MTEVKMIELLAKSMYVDDCISSTDSEEQTEEFKNFSCGALAKAGMELRKWNLTSRP